jgi:NADH dehydrogenase
MSRIFVTGASGFVGRRVVADLVGTGQSIVALSRVAGLASPGPGVQWVTGDLLDPDSYRSALSSCDTVIHLAAATGKASRADHARVNVAGTECLVQAARQAGVSRFLFVSSVAVTFPRIAGYHYAAAKRAAEAVVRSSGLYYVIVRPTIVLGQGSPVAGALRKLANLPVVIVPGSGRARVQPIDVDDLARAIVRTACADRFENRIVEIGGPEVLTIQDLVLGLRDATRSPRPSVVHIPLFLLRPPLRIAEAVGLGRLLPLTAGQLSSFEFDGVAHSNEVDATAAELTREARVFTRHLLGVDPSDYVIAQYRKAHDSRPELAIADPFDRSMVTLARRHRIAAKLVDAGAAVLQPRGVLRRKMVLLIAILESTPPFHAIIDRTPGLSRPSSIARMVWTGAVAAATVIVGVLVLTPMRLLALTERERA